MPFPSNSDSYESTFTDLVNLWYDWSGTAYVSRLEEACFYRAISPDSKGSRPSRQ